MTVSVPPQAVAGLHSIPALGHQRMGQVVEHRTMVVSGTSAAVSTTASKVGAAAHLGGAAAGARGGISHGVDPTVAQHEKPHLDPFRHSNSLISYLSRPVK